MDTKLIENYLRNNNEFIWKIYNYEFPEFMKITNSVVNIKNFWENRIHQPRSSLENNFINFLFENYPYLNYIPEFPILIPDIKKWKKICKKNKRLKGKEDSKLFYIDFYFPEYALGVEIDGNQHLVQKDYDKERDNIINSLGITILRFPNFGRNPEIINLCTSKFNNILNSNYSPKPLHINNFNVICREFQEVFEDILKLVEIISIRFSSSNYIEINYLDFFRMSGKRIIDTVRFESFYYNITGIPLKIIPPNPYI